MIEPKKIFPTILIIMNVDNILVSRSHFDNRCNVIAR